MNDSFISSKGVLVLTAAIYYMVTTVPTTVLRDSHGFSVLSLSKTEVDTVPSPILPMTLRLRDVMSTLENDVA